MKKLLLPAFALSLVAAPAFAVDNPIEQGMKDTVYKECHIHIQGNIVKEFGTLLWAEHNYCTSQKGKCVYTKAHKCSDWKDIDAGKIQYNPESITDKASQSVKSKTQEISQKLGM